MAKRTKQTQQMVDKVNKILKNNKVNMSNQYDDANNAASYFHVMSALLMEIKCYEGYNEYYEKTIIDDNGNIKYIDVLTGGSMTSLADVPNDKRYIQLY